MIGFTSFNFFSLRTAKPNSSLEKIKRSFALTIIFFAVLFILLNNIGDLNNIKSIKIAGQDIKVELALTSEEQIRGLSGRTSLEDNAGMLFIFSNSGEHFFWMQEMNFPIDIIWFGGNKQIIYIKQNAQPENFPETYGPAQDSKYVLEVPAGFADRHNFKIGDRVKFVY